MVKKMEITHGSQILTNDRQILVLSYLSNYYYTVLPRKILRHKTKIFESLQKENNQ